MQVRKGLAARPSSLLAILLLAIGAGPAAAQYSAPMRDVDNPDRAPYQESVSFTLEPPFANGFALFPTPANKRYVVEYVSIRCTSQAAGDVFPQAFLIVRNPSTSSSSVVLTPLQFSGPAPIGGYVYSTSLQLKAYSDPDPTVGTGGTAISLNVFHTAASARASCFATITGHTVTP